MNVITSGTVGVEVVEDLAMEVEDTEDMEEVEDGVATAPAVTP